MSTHNYETGKTSTYSRMVYTPDFLIRIEGSEKPIAIEVKGFRRADLHAEKEVIHHEVQFRSRFHRNRQDR